MWIMQKKPMILQLMINSKSSLSRRMLMNTVGLIAAFLQAQAPKV